MEFKDILKILLDEENVKPKAFARKLGVDHASIYDYLNGGLPKVDRAVKIANYFNCTLNYLFGLDIYPDEYKFYSSYDIQSFYHKYLNLLQEKNITHYYFSKQTGMSESRCDSWKKGGIPKIESLIEIAKYFNVSIDYLIGRSDTP